MRLAAFEGEWAIERTIADIRTGGQGALIGAARFTPTPQGLDYAETGLLTLGDGPPVAASRAYRWRDAGADAIDVHFEDGRIFHRFDPTAAAPEAVHDCPPDVYRVTYAFRDWPVWRAEWRVEGPRKDYAMITIYRRDDAMTLRGN